MTAVQVSGVMGSLAVGCSWPSPPRPLGPVESDYIYDMNRVSSETNTAPLAKYLNDLHGLQQAWARVQGCRADRGLLGKEKRALWRRVVLTVNDWFLPGAQRTAGLVLHHTDAVVAQYLPLLLRRIGGCEKISLIYIGGNCSTFPGKTNALLVVGVDLCESAVAVTLSVTESTIGLQGAVGGDDGVGGVRGGNGGGVGRVFCEGEGEGAVEGQEVALVLHFPLQGGVPVVFNRVVCP